MTRKQRIQKAKAFTQANEETSGVKLISRYILASELELSEKSFRFRSSGDNNKKQVWAIDAEGIATTEF